MDTDLQYVFVPFKEHYLYLVGGFKQFFIFHNIWDNPSH